MLKLLSVFAAVCREPYRLFFPLGVLAGTIGIAQWFLYAVGLIYSYCGFFHSSLQTMVYINCFIAGFLMTALPRFTMSAPARGWEVVCVLMIFLGVGIYLALEEWVIAESISLGWYAFLMYFALSRIRQRPRHIPGGNPPRELVWVPVALAHGIIGTAIFLLGQTRLLPLWALKVGKPMMEQGFLTALVMGVGSFLIARLMGIIRPSSLKIRGHLGCAFLFFVSFWVEGLGQPAAGYLLRASAVTVIFYQANILGRWPRTSAFFVRSAWISVWMVVLGFWGAGLWNKYQMVMLHLTFLGGFSLMTFAVASMVIMSHAGQNSRLQTGLGALGILALAVLTALACRLAVALWPDLYFQLLGIGAGAWMVGAWAWLLWMLPVLGTVSNTDEFGKMHEAAKAGVNLKETC